MSFSIPTGLKLLTDIAGFSHIVAKSALRELVYDPKTPETKDLSNEIEREIRRNHRSLGYKALVEFIKEILGIL